MSFTVYYYPMQQSSTAMIDKTAVANSNNIIYPPNVQVYPVTIEQSDPLQSTSALRNRSISFFKQTDKKAKRSRTAFTGSQLLHMEAEFGKHMYLYRKRRIEIAQRLALSEKQVKIWFQNRRIKHKREIEGNQETKYTTKATKPLREPNTHKGIVKRLMSYSQCPPKESAKKPCERTIQNSSTSAKMEISTNNLLPNQSPPFNSELNEILDYLSENSTPTL